MISCNHFNSTLRLERFLQAANDVAKQLCVELDQVQSSLNIDRAVLRHIQDNAQQLHSEKEQKQGQLNHLKNRTVHLQETTEELLKQTEKIDFDQTTDLNAVKTDFNAVQVTQLEVRESVEKLQIEKEKKAVEIAQSEVRLNHLQNTRVDQLERNKRKRQQQIEKCEQEVEKVRIETEELSRKNDEIQKGISSLNNLCKKMKKRSLWKRIKRLFQRLFKSFKSFINNKLIPFLGVTKWQATHIKK